MTEFQKQPDENVPEVDFQQHGLNVPTTSRRGSNRNANLWYAFTIVN